MKTIAQQLNVKDFPFKIKDSNGKEIYYETSDAFWVKREYDSKGNDIYHENSNGYWRKSKYDSKGNETYYEKSDGSWCKIEYDSEGNSIYFEDSNGWIEDNRNIPEYTMQDLVDKIGRFKFKL